MKTTLAALIGAALLTACGGASAEPQAGDPSVHARIAAAPDCPTVYQDFDLAMTSAERRTYGDPLQEVSMAYVDTAMARARELDCLDSKGNFLRSKVGR